jgi:hypothetical protein
VAGGEDSEDSKEKVKRRRIHREDRACWRKEARPAGEEGGGEGRTRRERERERE